MNKHTEKQLTRFMSILKYCNLSKEEIFSICSMMKTEQMLVDIVKILEEKDFKTTHQETMNICSQVIKKNSL